MLDSETIEGLSPGIRDIVVALDEAGFVTSDSGDGTNLENGMAGALDCKHVVVCCEADFELAPAEARRLQKWAEESPLIDFQFQVELTWAVGDPVITLMLYDITAAIKEFCDPDA